MPDTDDSISVIINEGYTHKKYTPADFDKNLVKSVKVNEYSSDKLQSELKLRNPGEENLKKLIGIAEAKPEVDYTVMNLMYYVDIER